MSGATKAPRKATLVAIEAVLREEERRRRETPEPAPGRNYTYDYVLIKKLIPVYFQGGTSDWNSIYFYRYFKLPNIKRVYTLDDAGEIDRIIDEIGETHEHGLRN